MAGEYTDYLVQGVAVVTHTHPSGDPITVVMDLETTKITLGRTGSQFFAEKFGVLPGVIACPYCGDKFPAKAIGTAAVQALWALVQALPDDD